MYTARTGCWNSVCQAGTVRVRLLNNIMHVLLAVLVALPSVVSGAEINLTMYGPKVVREGDLVEYRLILENAGQDAIDGIEVTDFLPASTDFVDAKPQPFGTYDPLTGIWAVPTLGTGEDDRTAGLVLQVLVHTNLLADSNDVDTLVNRAEVTVPAMDTAETASVTSYIVCPFCIDWQVLDAKILSRLSSDGYSYDGIRFVIDVFVANNGPVSSEATVTATYFSVSGGGFGKVQLKPDSPVRIALDAGASRRVRFLSTWEDLPESNYWVAANFAVNDVALHDPIKSNTVEAIWKAEVDGDGSSSSDGSGGCTLNVKNGLDPVWMLLALLPFMRLLRREP